MHRDGKYYQYGQYHRSDRNYHFTKHDENAKPKYDILKVNHDTPEPIYPIQGNRDTHELEEIDWKREESPKATRAKVLIEHW